MTGILQHEMKIWEVQPALLLLVGQLLCITDLCRGIDHGMQDDWEFSLYMCGIAWMALKMYSVKKVKVT
jgi:hypothetical protein